MSHRLMRNRQTLSTGKVVFLMTLILGAGALLRLVNLGKISFWVDELNTFYTAQSLEETGEMTLPSGLSYNRAPLQIYLTAALFKIAPANVFTTRLPVALFGLLSIWMTYILAKRVFNRRVALLSAFFVAFSHFEIGWSRTARMYTLLQLLTLLFIYFMVRFMETRRGERMQAILWVEGEAVHIRMKHFIRRWGLSFGWLLPALIVCAAAYLYVHSLAIFLPVGVMAYLFFMAFVGIGSFQGRERWLNKYTVLLASGMAIAVVALITMPTLRASIPYFLHYTPPWARSGSAANRMMLFDFLMSPYRFPFAALFFIGTIQAFFRFHRRGILMAFLFAVPLFLLSFLFTHRTQTYLFYVYPLFMILAAYGGMNLVEVETRVSFGMMKRFSLPEHELTQWFQRHLTHLIPLAFTLVLLIAPWLRISLKTPFLPDGINNGAVTPSEWSGGMEQIKANWRQGDLLLSSLPATSLFYGRTADYCLNWSLLRQAREERAVNGDDQWMDVYGGTPCIESLETLQALIAEAPRGWIIVESVHWEAALYVPSDVRQWIELHLGDAQITPQGTVLLFHWDRTEGH